MLSTLKLVIVGGILALLIAAIAVSHNVSTYVTVLVSFPDTISIYNDYHYNSDNMNNNVQNTSNMPMTGHNEAVFEDTTKTAAQIATDLYHKITASPESSNFTLALCHKALFSQSAEKQVDLQSVINWASYHYLLGFDKVFVYYLPDVANHTDFISLQQLPFVELIIVKDAHVKQYPDGYIRIDKQGPGSQSATRRDCLQRVSGTYTWAMTADADEYLWFNRSMISNDNGTGENKALTIKQFMVQQGLTDHVYLSFGKWMYTMNYTTEQVQRYLQKKDNATETYFRVDQFPFTPKSYCWSKWFAGRGDSYCTISNGRAKVMVKPDVYNETWVHGLYRSLRKMPGHLHFDTSRAHVKEWPSLSSGDTLPAVVMPPQTRTESSNYSFGIHGEYAYLNDADGNFVMHYDPDLHIWMRQVIELANLDRSVI